VHRKGYHADLVEGRVRWDLTPGAYDQFLATLTNTAPGSTDSETDSDTGAGPASGSDYGEPPATRTYDVWGELESAAPGRGAATSDAPAPPWRP
jgi:hypothetical protein